MFCALVFVEFTYVIAQPQSDLEKLDILGKVRSMHITSYRAIEHGDTVLTGEREWESFFDLDEKKLFDEWGFLKEHINYDNNFLISGVSFIEYDSLHRLETSLRYNAHDSVFTEKVYNIYNEQGDLIKELIEHYHDEYGLYGGDSSVVEYYHEFDDKHNKVRTTGGMYGFETLHTYNDAGLKIKEVTFKEGYSVTELVKYDHRGYRIEKKRVVVRDGIVEVVECDKFEHNERSELTAWIDCNSDCEEVSRRRFIYDNGGRLVKVEKVLANGELEYTYTYKYDIDEHGNWVREYKYLNGRPTFIIERTFEYY